MTELPVDKHIQAARRELRVHSWDSPRVEAGLRELGLRRLAARAHARRIATTAGALAVAALLTLAVIAFRVVVPGAATAPKAKVGAAAFERIALGEATEVRFLRGTRVDVREQTDVRVVVGVEAGVAHFAVRHDPRRLFRVEAGNVEIEDLGTTFEVENVGSSVRVSVSEGSVAVSFRASDGGGRRRVTLNAGQSGTYPSEHPSSESAAAAVSPAPIGAPSAEAPSGTAQAEPSADWRELARAGKHRQAYELIAPRGFRDVRDEPVDLLLASDVARLSRHPADAVALLRKLATRHERDSRAPSAAFTLGWVLMNDLGRPREAALAFARAEALAPRGNLAEDAVARAVEAWHRAGDASRAKAEVERYEKVYPNGRHRAMLKRLVMKP